MEASGCELTNEEYEAQFLGVTPSMLLDGVERVMSERMNEALDQLETHLSKVPEEVLPSSETKAGMATLCQETDKHFIKTMHKFKNHARKLLSVPPEILHPADLEQANPTSASEVNILKTEIDKLLLQLKNEKYMQAKYKEELSEIDEVLQEQHRVLNVTLSPEIMGGVDSARDKLTFVQTNQAELMAAGERARDVTDQLMNTHIHTPSQLFAAKTFNMES